MGMIKNALLAGAVGTFAAVVAVSAAQADTFGVSIYQGTCNGGTSACAAGPQNTTPTGGAVFTTLVATGTYSPSLNFNYPGMPSDPNTIATFLSDGTGSYTASTGSTTGTLSTNGTGTQTEFIFTGTLSGPANITISHDDGIAFLLGSTLISPVGAENPTSDVATTFSALTGGSFTLYYVSSNGLPEVLDMTVSYVPLPASVWLFGAALGGLGLLMRRRRNSALALTA